MNDSNTPFDLIRRRAVILSMIATVAASIIAALQTDASIRTDVANRGSQHAAIQVSGALFRQGLRSDYDLGTFASMVKDAQEATLLQLTALELEQEGRIDAAEATLRRADLAMARAERLGSLSVLLTDPAFGPEAEDGIPDLEGYLEASFVESNQLVSLQNAAADEYDRWNQKSDRYVAILALMAMSLFLFGLAQAASLRMQPAFIASGTAVLVLSLVWTMLVLLA